ncbi:MULTISPECIES: EcoAI/FtnUII family type I restriction enzme subunit R [unclassified Marinobacter]|jgi:type I restriction enzyme R subunit|uniref:EcoAI/FtnUII family type I restriction enzme subunit R n=1 Tax=unclassified Marinobacter TaxID=83889 RepID=UPI00200CD02F|nr:MULTISPECIES: type I restriction endonuclease subunit R [unclassified Marinobacter]MCL1476771.1 DEAD/DEAH box helicase family protein [Marinobacter sp.]MCL1479871.1 DEAD/DEAH box helicase family protein [Marinobacter sp.]MCL1484986.1 DEAD/DEAH box helicase family protein [Marinobacter sp.]MCL1488066.1 DEAD/DEAH box helicase family protein [Marinobacter sp.]UQG57299.1 DEAD/DEAH box helicase family protein [Marinobacter sp. M4C]
MKEADTRAEHIDPALRAAGWGVVPASRVRREVIAPGRLIGGGKRGPHLRADYVLIYKGQKLGVVEAKMLLSPVTEGLAQAKEYAERLQVRFAYSTNGKGIYRVDMKTGKEGPIEAYPSPEELWAETFSEFNVWRERFGAVPFEDKGGFWQPRYYQHNAISQALEAMADGRERILLTLATGTGKTAIAFQIAWKLFHARWTLGAQASGDLGRQPRILFLADRNILANQAFNDFSAFPQDALVRIDPETIRKHGRVPKNGSVFFTIFQTFMTGRDENGDPEPNFGDYPPDFFDMIIIDECHRGGANDESNWRGIMEYFSPAVQLGLTATPKRDNNADTYAYFGEPVYIYSLKEGINDGYLTPFKVRQIATTLDDYVYTRDDDVVEGEIEEGRRYTEAEFNRIIEIEAREKYRVRVFMDHIDQREKTLVFCATQAHALAVRDLINQMKTNKNPHYCERVTADDGKEGERFLRQFQDNEKSIPTILTTSQKLSTGVDARNVRNIVLMRPVNSMIEFKQIIGRGTRLFDGKDYFTVYDFVRAYEHFNDPEWDGEPLAPEPCDQCGQIPCNCAIEPPEPCKECGERPCVCEKEPPEPCPECGAQPCTCQQKRKIKIKLADGKERTIQHMSATSFWSPDGKPMSAAEFIQHLHGDLPEWFADEDKLRELWSQPDTRIKLLNGLEEKGYGIEQLKEIGRMIEAEKSDIYDVLAYVAFNLPPITRSERVAAHLERIYSQYDYRQHEFLKFVLDHYVQRGVTELDPDKLPQLIELKYHTVRDAVSELGPVGNIREVFVGFQRNLY